MAEDPRQIVSSTWKEWLRPLASLKHCGVSDIQITFTIAVRPLHPGYVGELGFTYHLAGSPAITFFLGVYVVYMLIPLSCIDAPHVEFG